MSYFSIGDTTTTTVSTGLTWDNYTTSNCGWCSTCNIWYYGHHCCTPHCYGYYQQVVYKYKYQVSCPKCETKVFAEIDEKVKCPKCAKVILVKAAEKKDYDFEVEV